MKPPEARPAKGQAMKAQPQVTDTLLRQFTGYNLKRAYLVIETELHRILKDHDLRVTSFSALAIIVENPGLPQTALANALQIERSSTVVIVDALEGRELIQRNKVETDRRAYALVATLRGRQMFEKISGLMHEVENRFQSGLTPAERDALTGALRTIEHGGDTAG